MEEILHHLEPLKYYALKVAPDFLRQQMEKKIKSKMETLILGLGK